MTLVSQADFEARLNRELTTDESNNFKVINSAVQSSLERYIGSSISEASESTRYYNGGVQNLQIDPCTAITRVGYYDEDQTLIYTHDTSDYLKFPINTTLKTMIQYRPGRLDAGIANIGVTAKFSTYDDTQTTSIIKDAILNILTNEVSNSSNVKRESIEGYSVEFFTPDSRAQYDKVINMFQMII